MPLAKSSTLSDEHLYMKYQLVLQWPGVPVADCDRLISLEETIMHGLGNSGIADGHDFGSGEMNILFSPANLIQHLQGSRLLLRPGKT